MQWYEHLFGILAILAIIGIIFGYLLIYALYCVLAAADRHIELNNRGEGDDEQSSRSIQ